LIIRSLQSSSFRQFSPPLIICPGPSTLPPHNPIAFDPRNMGLTKPSLSAKRDSWVDAADVAEAHELLQLPPCHVFAVAMNSGGAALRLAILFPAKCLSLCICAAPVQAGDELGRSGLLRRDLCLVLPRRHGNLGTRMHGACMVCIQRTNIPRAGKRNSCLVAREYPCD